MSRLGITTQRLVNIMGNGLDHYCSTSNQGKKCEFTRVNDHF